jgi:hypothetical protein
MLIATTICLGRLPWIYCKGSKIFLMIWIQLFWYNIRDRVELIQWLHLIKIQKNYIKYYCLLENMNDALYSKIYIYWSFN